MVTAEIRAASTMSIPHPLGNVLLAEDDPDLLDLLASFLRRRGYRVFCVGSGAALLARLACTDTRGVVPPIDVIVSDVYMPDRDGLRALHELREQGHRVPVILMTAFGSRDLHEQGRRQGATLVLDKPFELDALLAAVDRARFPHAP